VGLIASTLAFSAHASDNVAVSVKGTGPSIDEARTDAIRQALQQTIAQLVIVERAIKNDEVLRDSVISTMNGYVDKFHERQVGKDADGFVVEADVTVSTSRIENFIGVATGGSVSFDGSSLLAEANREAAQRKARGEIFDRLFRGFPSETLDVKITAIKPNEIDPNSLSIDVEYSLKPEFRKALTETLRVLGLAECQASAPTWPLAADRRCQEYNYRGYDQVCMRDSKTNRCVFLKEGDYCSYCNAPWFSGLQIGGDIVLLGRFVDRLGLSVLSQNRGALFGI
jgi:hypothetical protein